jgi:hypothetical protein
MVEFVAGSAFEARAIRDRAPTDLCVRQRRFVLHQDREDIAAGRICDATRVRSYVTLSGIRVTAPGLTLMLESDVPKV